MNLYNVLSNRYVGMSNFERLFAQKFGGSGGEIKELEGAPPLTFTANGQPLLDYLISGNTVQNGTPTPENPIMPIGCGELETTGVHAGQYKLPLTSTGQNVDIYLGEAQTTRKIKRLVLTGDEDWVLNNNRLMFIFKTTGAVSYENLACTHYVGVKSFSEVYGITNSTAVTERGIYINRGSTDVSDFKSFLAAQYAAGTPVTIWYVLAEPETGIVNEPLMKIGDYADTVSMEQAGVSIPTNKGSTTLDVDTTIKPSNVYIKYHT